MLKTILIIILVLVLSLISGLLIGYSQTANRVNAGDGNYTDAAGQFWVADRSYTSGSFGNLNGIVYSNPVAIANTEDDTLYQSNIHNTSFEYRFDLINGSYTIILHFAEIYPPNQVTGNRIFDVIAEGVLVLDDYDIFTRSGGANIAVIESFVVSVSDGQLNIIFSASNSHAVINAIEVLGLTAPTSTFTPTITLTSTLIPTVSPVLTLTPTPIATPTATAVPTLTSTPLPIPPSGFICTMIIGYSQVGIGQIISGYGWGWYVAGKNNFETVVRNDNFQLLWDSGHGVDQWQDPNATGWDKWQNREYPFFQSPCLNQSGTPDRIILSISGSYGNDLSAWQTNIKAAIVTIIQQIPSVRQIVLEPVVGGPNHQACECTQEMTQTITGCSYGPTIRASWQHAYIDLAIESIILDIQYSLYNPPTEVLFGYSPEVFTCSDYFDGIGHLTENGATLVGNNIAQFYQE